MEPLSSPELEQAPLLGDLARPLFHECNNFINNLLLQIALVETMAPAELRDDFKVLKKNGRRLAELIGEWQGFRKAPPEASALDLFELFEEVLREVTRDLQASEDLIMIKAPPDPLIVRSVAGPLKRICYFLLADAISAAVQRSPAGLIEVHFEKTDRVTLRINDNRVLDAQTDFKKWFDLPERGRRLPLVACTSLAVRCGVELGAVHSPLGGVQVVVQFSK